MISYHPLGKGHSKRMNRAIVNMLKKLQEQYIKVIGNIQSIEQHKA